MPEVDRYRVVLYGSSTEKPDLKGKIELYAQGGDTLTSIGKIRFHEGKLPHDSNKKGDYVMNLPVGELRPVVDILRREKPIYFAFHEGRAVLGTGIEKIGWREKKAPQLVRVVDEPEAPEPPVKEPTSPKPE